MGPVTPALLECECGCDGSSFLRVRLFYCLVRNRGCVRKEGGEGIIRTNEAIKGRRRARGREKRGIAEKGGTISVA
jgi:hypothetical protein